MHVGINNNPFYCLGSGNFPFETIIYLYCKIIGRSVKVFKY